MSAAPDQPSQSPKHKDSAWGGSAGSNLYLATFLATLFLLLFGSCCIVVRSYMMRRRFRHHIREMFSPEGSGNTHARCRCRKRRPKFYDRWIAPAAGPSWADIMPLSLRIVFGKRSSKPEETKPNSKSEPKKSGLISWRHSSCSSTVQQEPSGNAANVSTKFEIAQVSVLIEMPSLARSTLYGPPSSRLKSLDDYDDDDDKNHGTLPELVIGYARCHKHWWMDVITDVTNTKNLNTEDQQSPQ